MKLSKRQFCIAVDTYKSMIDEEQEMLETLGVNVDWKPSEWINNYYELLTDLCELETNAYAGTDLDWFCFDADFGRGTCGKIYDPETGRTWTIETPEILYDYITRND